jgi:2-polyprenyl-3-methyl-5-hydroxy-6-metoxy-1,4-benzoquinol methylase
MPDFSVRSAQMEMMDNLDCSGPLIHQTLRELEIINTWLGGNAVTLSGVSRLLANADRKKEIIIADLGCGGGDMLQLIDRWAQPKKYTLKLIGFDANPHIIEFARESAKGNPRIHFEALDIFSEAFRRRKFDIVIGTLFYHHFTTEQLVAFFSALKKQTAIGVVINDIHRHPLAYYSIMYLTRLFSRSAMVKSDAPISVLRAFSKSELEEILRKASFNDFSIEWKWAFRWQVVARTTTRPL